MLLPHFIPFRYKLALLITGIIAALMLVVFLLVQQGIEREFRSLISAELIRTEQVVASQMQARFENLLSDAIYAEGDALTRLILTNDSYDLQTRNDILSGELFPDLVHASFLFVSDASGSVKARAKLPPTLIQTIQESAAFAKAKAGEEAAGYVMHEGRYQQFIALPSFLQDTMIGIIVAGRSLTSKDLEAIKSVSHIDLNVLADTTLCIGTDWDHVSDQPQTAFGGALEASLAESMPMAGKTYERNLLGERFLVRLWNDEEDFMPPTLLLRSLDKQLAFVDTIRGQMLLVGGAALLVAVLVGFAFASGISRPIGVLEAATREVEAEHFTHRVRITSRDEFARLGNSFNTMIEGLAEKKKVRDALNKSVSSEVADYMLARGAKLGGESRDATLLFSDIRGFTSLSERLSGPDLVRLLNRYFDEVSRPIHAVEGTIDKFIGDAIMALFGIPAPDERHPIHAIEAALGMIETLSRLNPEFEKDFGCQLEIGIGINTGRVVAGMVGASNRLNYTALGDSVNLAARIESLTKPYGTALLISEYTMQRLSAAERASLRLRGLDRVQVKGKSEPCRIYEVLGRADDAAASDEETFETAYLHLASGQLRDAEEAFASLASRSPADRAVASALTRTRRYLQEAGSHAQDYENGVRALLEK